MKLIIPSLRATAAIATSIALLTSVSAFAGSSVNTITAQSAQVSVTGIDDSYVLTEGGHYRYLRNFDPYFTYTTTGSINATQLEGAIAAALNQNKCAFFDGTALSGGTKTFGSAAKAVTWTPRQASYDPKTNWTLLNAQVGDMVTIDITNLFVSSESYNLSSTTSKNKTTWSNKYSFSMLDPYGASRLVGLTVAVKDSNGNIITSVNPAHTVEQGADWFYIANAGVFGNATAQGGLISDDSVANILLADDFAGNNGVGGSRGVAVGPNDPTLSLPVPLIEGTYYVEISGVIKGNSFLLDQPFTVTATGATVTTGSCH